MSFESDQSFPFGVLGIDKPDTVTRKQVKSAYARRLKTIDQASDAEAFQELRGALELALHLVELRERSQEDDPDAQTVGASAGTSSGPDVQQGELQQETGENGGLPADEPEASSPGGAVASPEGEPQPDPAISAVMRDRLAEIETLGPSHTANRKISEMLDDPDFAEFEANRLLGLVVANFLERAIEWRDDDTPRFAPDVTKAFLQKLDERYHWLADYRALEDFTYQPEILHAAIFLTVNGYPAVGQEVGIDKMAPIDGTLGIAVLISFFGGILARALDPGTMASVVVGWVVTVAVVIVFAILAFKIVGKLLGSLFRRDDFRS